MIQDFRDFDPSIAEEFGYDITSQISFLGVPLCDTQNLIHLLMRFAFNLLVSWLIVRFCYYRKSGRRDYVLTFMLFSSAMFLLIFLMENVKLQIGLTLGLFAIFGVIRYRTETVPVREMTYQFVIIATAVINGLALNISYAELYVTLNAPAPVDNFKTAPLSRDNYINRVRLAMGTEYKIDRRNRLDFYYMVHFNREFRARYKAGSGDMKEWSLVRQCNHVFGIDYNFKL